MFGAGWLLKATGPQVDFSEAGLSDCGGSSSKVEMWIEVGALENKDKTVCEAMGGFYHPQLKQPSTIKAASPRTRILE